MRGNFAWDELKRAVSDLEEFFHVFSESYLGELYDDPLAVAQRLREGLAKEPKVEFCAWCDDPHHPSIKFHPDGRIEHEEPKQETWRDRSPLF